MKLEDRELSKAISVFAYPAIVMFRNNLDRDDEEEDGNENVFIYAGDISDENAILQWIFDMKDPSKFAIDSRDAKDLHKLIHANENVATLLCETSVLM